jgi:hypothetical protein
MNGASKKDTVVEQDILPTSASSRPATTGSVSSGSHIQTQDKICLYMDRMMLLWAIWRPFSQQFLTFEIRRRMRFEVTVNSYRLILNDF